MNQSLAIFRKVSPVKATGNAIVGKIGDTPVSFEETTGKQFRGKGAERVSRPMLAVKVTDLSGQYAPRRFRGDALLDAVATRDAFFAGLGPEATLALLASAQKQAAADFTADPAPTKK